MTDTETPMAVDAPPTEPQHVVELRAAFNEAEDMEEAAPERSLATFAAVLADAHTDDAVLKLKERAIYRLAAVHTRVGNHDQVVALLRDTRPFFLTIPKAKTAKIVRSVIDIVAKGSASKDLQERLCRESIAWCEEQSRTFLRQRLEVRLAQLLFADSKQQEALTIVNRLSKEVKKLDDKQLLLEVHLIESKVHHALRNNAKAKASLTAARTCGHAIYVVPSLQAQIDQQAGTLHAEERDYNTAYSYFLEAFEALHAMGGMHGDALRALKYLLLCKIMDNKPQDVSGLTNSKTGVQYASIDVDAMLAVAEAQKQRSLALFEQASDRFSEQLSGDALIQRHLGHLAEQLLEANLVRIIEPFSVVEIDHVASLIDLPRDRIEPKLSQMILDGKFHGILDQGQGHLLIYDASEPDRAYTAGLGVISNLGNVVDSLFRRASHIH